MTNKEIDEFYQFLLEEKKKVETSTKEEAQTFLKRIGVLTKKGNIAKPYDQLWTLKPKV